MEYQVDIAFLFDISKEIKQYYENAVIFVTMKDYSDSLFNAMCNIRKALKEHAKDMLIDLIVEFHLQWLQAVNEINHFMKRLNDMPREEMYQAISYTIDAMGNRLNSYQRYVENSKSQLSNAHRAHLLADLEIIDEMHKEVILSLLEKLKCFRVSVGNDEFNLKVVDSVDELLQWLDKINGGLANLLCKYLNVNVPQLSGDLTKTLRQIVDELQSANSTENVQMLEDLKDKDRKLSTMIRLTAGHSLEISKVVEKINILEDHIKRLESAPSSAAVMDLQNKKDFLAKRLASLETLKTTINNLHQKNDITVDLSDADQCICEDFYQLRIFNHFLPIEEREKLVKELCFLWDLAVFGQRSRKSIISILSAADIKEEYVDDLGTFFIDEHSRKIYKRPDNDKMYQPNELNELVSLTDDADHVYFYDECGRYFIDSCTRQRIYKAHESASEYMLDASGILLKVKEELDGITYYYDNYGRYYINDGGKHIYRENDQVSEYENDGLGNLVRIRSHLDLFEPCPDDVHVTDDFKYLKQTVGPALRKCIADVIMQQPADPIKYLSASLVKFRENIEMRNKWQREKEELNVEREIRLAEERVAAERAALEAAMLIPGGSEASYDSNMLMYSTVHPDDVISVATSSK